MFKFSLKSILILLIFIYVIDSLNFLINHCLQVKKKKKTYFQHSIELTLFTDVLPNWKFMSAHLNR